MKTVDQCYQNLHKSVSSLCVKDFSNSNTFTCALSVYGDVDRDLNKLH
jgi:hypothetical protein